MIWLRHQVEKVARAIIVAYNRQPSPLDFRTTHEVTERELRGITKLVNDQWAAVLADHYVTAVECDHAKKTDIVRCSCSKWTGTPQPSVGAAIRQWILHVVTIVIERQKQEVER